MVDVVGMVVVIILGGSVGVGGVGAVQALR